MVFEELHEIHDFQIRKSAMDTRQLHLNKYDAEAHWAVYLQR